MGEPKIDLRAELPFRVEYSKSNRASCKGCKSLIDKDVIRLAKMVKSFKFDGVSPHWYHFDCFFNKIKPKSTSDIAHFSEIRYEDQKRIQEILKDAKCSVDKFTIEYAKSSRSACSLCELKINKDEIRIAKMDDESDAAFQFGRAIPRWFHVDCFVKSREDLDFTSSGDSIPNFTALESEDQELIKKKIPALSKKRKGEETKNESDSKKSKKESKSDEQISKKLKKQSDLLYKAIDFLKTLKKNELANLAKENGIELSNDSTKNYDMLADAIVFGALKPCSKCGSQMRFRIAGYICLGHIDEWTPCTNETKNPSRKPFVIPEELKDTKFFKSYKFVERKRLYPEVQAQVSATTINSLFNSPSTSNENENAKEDIAKPLSGHSISLIGNIKSNSSIKSKIKNLGGKVSNMDRTTLFAIIDKNEIDSEKYNSKIAEAKKLGVVLVSESVLKYLKNKTNRDDVPSVIMKHSLRDWGINVNSKYVNLVNTGKVKSFKSGFKSGKSNIPDKQVVTLKGGDVLDPRSGLENNAHVYKDGINLYSVTLNKVDLVKNKNSYYKLQLLQSDYDRSTFWIFSAWGRTGTTIGDFNLKEFRSVENAISFFKNKYADLTGNDWEERNNFVKKPGHYYPMDISYDEIKISKLEVGHSKLPIQIQKIMCMIFDLELMKKELNSFELDLNRMPLGKISKKQISEAYSVLTEIGDLLDSDDKYKLLNCCNKFYTLIPHRFDNDKMKIFTSKDEISEKINMLDTMQDVEIAYGMIDLVNRGSFEDPILAHYEELGIVLEILEDPNDCELIQKYVENTHAPTHPIKLHIEDIFKLSRNKEEERYKPFAKSENRMLLWHGSRCSNFAGIFSQGLRIAPPSAPVTGYMFGKGIYFADMVTKSANYCHHSINDNYGLLLLCEVALGNMLELKDANYIKKLPKGKESVKGLGMREPDQSQNVVMKDGVIVPCGKIIHNKIESSLLYNEYVIYDVKRIKLRYLVKVKFEDKLI